MINTGLTPIELALQGLTRALNQLQQHITHYPNSIHSPEFRAIYFAIDDAATAYFSCPRTVQGDLLFINFSMSTQQAINEYILRQMIQGSLNLPELENRAATPAGTISGSSFSLFSSSPPSTDEPEEYSTEESGRAYFRKR